ncbi:CPBP family intramembrane metalloprotease [Fulvivirga sp. 29W222]|uniref:CPBP family intramembrane metalloprotease n=1 Tax=Fulvivirga marina TaxID=2494733 RepID=A0A937G204_9BACT|nr:CPBP family intramembrane glutamic endopeptidase [Fulvivirga marina]MBL6448530.1 CPBP family intramembrane metalloprotease [Fulvivirga marina]
METNAVKYDIAKPFHIKTLIQITVVMASTVGVKTLADYFGINGAGSIGIWTGILIATAFMKQEGIRWTDWGLQLPKGSKEWFIQLGLALLTVIGVFLLMGLVLDPLLNNMGLVKPAEAADRFRFFLGKPALFIAYLIGVIWFGAALGEELLMRGFLLNRLACFFGSNKSAHIIALCIHSIIFGAMHSYQGLHGIITTGFIAVIFGTVYLLAKRRLFIVILSHVLINTISLTAFYLTGGEVN